MSENWTPPPEPQERVDGGARKRRLAVFGLAGVLAAAIGAVALGVALRNPDTCGGTAAGADLGGPLQLTDHTGRRHAAPMPVDGPALVYFGYTYCPDVCPVDFAVMSDTVDTLDEMGLAITPVFVTIDPARDTPELLRAFIEPFHPRTVGLTGSEAEVGAAARAWRVFYARADTGDPEYYLMDHSTLTYLADRRGRYVAHFSRGTTPDVMAAGVACHARAGNIRLDS